jgi:hypothetical protein
MSDSIKAKKSKQERNKVLKDEHHLVDLSKFGPPEQFVCEDCTIHLLPFPQAQEQNLYSRGPFYICPRCHIVTDASIKRLEHADDIRPVDLSPPTIAIIQEDKGFGRPNDLKTRVRKDPDPEPQYEEFLKSTGATIIDKKVIASNDYS